MFLRWIRNKKVTSSIHQSIVRFILDLYGLCFGEHDCSKHRPSSSAYTYTCALSAPSPPLLPCSAASAPAGQAKAMCGSVIRHYRLGHAGACMKGVEFEGASPARTKGAVSLPLPPVLLPPLR